MPLQAAAPYATVAAGLETDWGHKSGSGRELRLTVTLRDQGERPARLRALAAEAQAALDGLAMSDGWQLVTLVFVRSMTVAEGAGRWAITLDYRARMLAGLVRLRGGLGRRPSSGTPFARPPAPAPARRAPRAGPAAPPGSGR